MAKASKGNAINLNTNKQGLVSKVSKVSTVKRQENIPGGVNKNILVRAYEFNSVVDRVNSIAAAEGVLISKEGSQTGSDIPTIKSPSGTITTAVSSEVALTYKTVTLTNSYITAKSKVFVSIGGYAGTGTPLVGQVTPAAGSVVIKIYNAHATAALSAAFDIDFLVIN